MALYHSQLNKFMYFCGQIVPVRHQLTLQTKLPELLSIQRSWDYAHCTTLLEARECAPTNVQPASLARIEETETIETSCSGQAESGLLGYRSVWICTVGQIHKRIYVPNCYCRHLNPKLRPHWDSQNPHSTTIKLYSCLRSFSALNFAVKILQAPIFLPLCMCAPAICQPSRHLPDQAPIGKFPQKSWGEWLGGGGQPPS